MNRISLYTLLLSLATLGLFSCATIPQHANAIHPFNKDKYLGKWYEVARFDFTFEKNLINTTAEYSQNKNGTIKVDNKGYDTIQKIWKQSIGKAKFVESDSIAMLKVSFFGPFYGGYNVIAIDEEYKYALITGSSLNYLWILSRETTIPEDVKANYLKIAGDLGYDTSKLLWIAQDKQK
jgi:apolipoprotein D and lipocalin family protein